MNTEQEENLEIGVERASGSKKQEEPEQKNHQESARPSSSMGNSREYPNDDLGSIAKQEVSETSTNSENSATETSDESETDWNKGKTSANPNTDPECETEEQGQNLESELEKAENQIEELKQSWGRERAEFQNYRKRIVQEKEKDFQSTICHLAGQFLPLLDNIYQMAQMKASSEEIKSYITGVNLIRNNFISILNENNIYETEPAGKEFDPLTMEAIASEESVEEEQINQVLDVFQSGFFYQKKEQEIGQVIRPARVKVGKAAKKD